MKKGEKLPRAFKTDYLVNVCPICEKKTPDHNLHTITHTLNKFVGVDEGSNKVNGQRLYFASCQNCKSVFYKTVPKDELWKDEIQGDYRILKVN